MSKKDKSKFRKRIKAQILQEMVQAQTEKPRSAATAPTVITKPISSPSKTETNLKMPEPDTKTTPGVSLPVSSSGDIGLVRQDLKKSAIIIGSIIIVIVALYFIDQKTGIVLKAGNELFRVLRIGV